MAQPVWTTPAGSLGSIPEGVFYALPLEAYDPDGGDVFYRVIAGDLPAGMQIAEDTGIMIGVPQNIVILEGVPTAVTTNITSKFVVRAYTKVLGTIARLADRTFEITVTAQNQPAWVTPSGQIGQYFDGSQVFDLQVEYTNVDDPALVTISLVAGQLPPGLTVSKTGLISGFIQPNTNAGVPPGFSYESGSVRIGFDQYPFDYSTISSTVNYQFVLELTDGSAPQLRTFNILVYSRNACTADNTQFTADSTFITADCTPQRTPILLNAQGSIGTVRNDNFYAYKFDGLDLDGDPITYTISLAGNIGYDAATVSFTPGSYDYPNEAFDQGGLTLPPGLTLDPNTGWFYGFIPDLGITEQTYNFSIRVYKTNNPTVISQYYYYSINIVGTIANSVTWLTPADAAERAKIPSSLGTIDNGMVSTLYVQAINTSGLPLQYRLQSGSTSNLPQGLQLLPEGDIAGRVSFDTFALDGGTTTFDVVPQNRALKAPTTFDMVHTFTVEAYSVNGVVSVFKTFSITVNRAYNEPFDNLYIQAMPPQNDRDILSSLLQNNDIFPESLLYRPQDPNFGLATKVVYWHAYGLTAATIEDYVNALDLNHYWKNLVLGSIETAQALDANGNVIYEVVYSRVVDNLVNNIGQSVGKEVPLAYPVNENNTEIDVVYPNALVDMRQQVIDQVGQISNVLPAWMTSQQANGQVLGFVPAWVIAYTKPGKSGQIAYNIKTQFGDRLNLVDFDVDRYELDNLLTKNWDRTSTTFNITNITNDPVLKTTTVTFGTRSTPPALPGETITISGVNPTVYNGSWTVLSCTTTTIVFSNVSITPTSYVSGGTVTVPPQWIPVPADTTFDVNPGPPTVFDGGSIQFVAPADMYSNTQIYDRYLLFPKRYIINVGS